MVLGSFEFVVYMIHACANKWNRLPSFVYRKLAESGCIQKFLVPNYEILQSLTSDAELLRFYKSVKMYYRFHCVA